MKKSIFLIIILVMAVSMGISCKSTPDAQQAIEVSKGRADEARQRAMDFEAPAYFPSDWEEIEGRYTAADSAAAFDAVANEYDELFKKTIPLYAQAREDEVMAAREQLINTGFAEIFPQYLKKADDMALAAQKQYEAEEYYEARDTVAAAMTEYELLQMGNRIFLTRQEVIDRGFTQFDAENFLKADEVAQVALEAYDAGDNETAVTNAEEAQLRYNLVLANGWTAYASLRKTAAVAERDHALTERANIASRDTFREADAIFNRAEENFAEENFSVAGLAFVEAEAMFAIARKETAERRVRAEETIKRAEEKIEESNEAAVEAERIIEGGSR
jgi:hypothetical protein